MTVAELIRKRLEELRREQRHLANAAHVTESYISQLVNGKKSPPAADRSDIYEKIESFLRLPVGALSKLAEMQRKQELKRRLDVPTQPLFKQVRELILQKCSPDKTNQLRLIFEKEAFGEIERFITQKLLDVAKGMAKEKCKDEAWLRMMAQLNRKSYEEMRDIVLEFLDADVLNLSVQNFVYFLEPLIKSWDIDLLNFGMTVFFPPELGSPGTKCFEFMEKELEPATPDDAGLRDFLADPIMSGGITHQELAFLKRLRFKGKCPTALYYYRELQNLRDPLNFMVAASPVAPDHG